LGNGGIISELRSSSPRDQGQWSSR
jgi:hypothetical protein